MVTSELRLAAQGLRDAVYGAAVGDALGVPYEFKGRGSFECTGMASGGVHGKSAGTFSDDTSMMLATCDSVRVLRAIDACDMRRKFNDWLHVGAYTADGDVFDVGGTVETALAAITHAHRISTESCVCLVKLIRNLIAGNTLVNSLRNSLPADDEFAFLAGVCELPRDEIRSGGYVLDTLAAAIWCFANTDSYADCVLAAVNLGSDSDTTACVAGALAGAVYGYDAIPPEWLDTLRGKDVIEASLF